MSEWMTDLKDWIRSNADRSSFLPVLRQILIDISDKASACFDLAEWLESEEDYPLVASAYEEGGSIAEDLKNFEKAFMGYANAGLYLHWTGDLAKAMTLYRQADQMLDHFEDHWRFSLQQAKVLLNLNRCDTLVELRRLDEALDYYQQLLALEVASTDVLSAVKCYLGIGNVFRNQSKLAQSLAAYRQAYELAVQNDLALYQARAKHGECNILVDFNRIEEAVECGEIALNGYQVVGDRQGVLEAISLLGHVYYSGTDHPKIKAQGKELFFTSQARSYFEQAVETAGDHDPVNVADARVKLACFLVNQAEYDSAFTMFQELLESAFPEKDYFTAYQMWHGLGELYLRRNDYQNAWKAFQTGLERSRHADDREGISKWQALLGATLEQSGELLDAIAAYRQSIVLQENIGIEIQQDQDLTGYFSLRIDVYQRIILIFLKKQEWTEAMDYLERSKAKSLRQMLADKNLERSSWGFLDFKKVKLLLQSQ